MTDPKELKQRAEESFKKRLGTLGYTMAQNSINPYVDGYQDCYNELEKELEKERKLNVEIKARFVKCNTCTPDMKDKCPMFHENLCEGERCEELVDLMSLVEKRDHDDKLEKAKEVIEGCIHILKHSGTALDWKYAIDKAEQFLKEIEQ
jgi:hypothetical protein